MKNKISKSLTQQLVEQGVKPQQIIDQVSGKFVGYGFVFDNVNIEGNLMASLDEEKKKIAGEIRDKIEELNVLVLRAQGMGLKIHLSTVKQFNGRESFISKVFEESNTLTEY